MARWTNGIAEARRLAGVHKDLWDALESGANHRVTVKMKDGRYIFGRWVGGRFQQSDDAFPSFSAEIELDASASQQRIDLLDVDRIFPLLTPAEADARGMIP